MKLPDKYQRWYRLSVERFEKEIDLVQIVERLRLFKQFMKESMESWHDHRFRYECSGKNVIDIDSDEQIEKDEEEE